MKNINIWLSTIILSVLGMAVNATTIVVNTDQDITADDGACSFREAAEAAFLNTISGLLPGECAAGTPQQNTDTIIFDLTWPAVINLDYPVAIDGNYVDVIGPGADKLHIISSFQTLKLQGHDYFISGLTLTGTLVGVSGGAINSNADNVTLKALRIVDSEATNGGGAYFNIANGSTVTIHTCEFSRNSASSNTEAAHGGGLAAHVQAGGTLNIKNSTFSDNTVTASLIVTAQPSGYGGGLEFTGEGDVNITRSTFSGNQANANGGGIYGGTAPFGVSALPNEYFTGNLDISHTTIAKNSVDDNGVGDETTGLYVHSSPSPSGNATIFNTIIANEASDASGISIRDIYLETPSANINESYNLIGDSGSASPDFPAGLPNAANSWIGNTVAGVIDPALGNLVDIYGGFTAVHYPNPAFSMARNQGSCPGETRDQRGFTIQPSGLREDNGSRCDIGAVEDMAVSPNLPPNPIPDKYVVNKDTALNTSIATGLLSNDIDYDDDPLVLVNTGTQSLSDGTLELFADGHFTFTGSSSYGLFAFDYTVSDGIKERTATATIYVANLSNPILEDDSYTTAFNTQLIANDENGALTADLNDNGVRANDNEDTTLAFFDATMGGIGGTFVGQQDGTFVYTPPTGVSGIATIGYNFMNRTATVSITVEAPVPPNAVDDYYTVPYNGALIATDVNGNIGNANDDGLLVNDLNSPTLTTSPGTFNATPLGGSVTLSADGTFFYNPPNGAVTGTDTFQYSVDDGSTGTVYIEVTSPVAVADTWNMNEDFSLTVSAASGVLANDNPTGTATVITTGVLPPIAGSTVDGDVVMAADGSFSFSPPANQYGYIDVLYRLQDDNGIHAATLSINVNPINDPPSFTSGGNITVPMNSGAINLDNWATNISPGPLESGQALSFDLTPSNVNGGLSFVTPPTIDATGTLSFEATNGSSGSVDIAITLTDDQGETSVAQNITLSVTNNNTAPVAVADSYNVLEDGILYADGSSVLTLLANDTDAEGNALAVTTIGVQTVAGIGGNLYILADGKFYYQPPANTSGNASFSYTVSDGLAQTTGTVSITVAEKNDKPQLQDDPQSGSFLEDQMLPALNINTDLFANDSAGPNEASQTLSLSAVGQAQGGTVSSTATEVQFVLNPDFNGSAFFRYQAVDDGTTDGVSNPKSGLAWVGYTIIPVNDAPTFTPTTTTLNFDQQYSANSYNAAWATNISPGASNETSQQVSFNLATSIQSGNLAFDTAPALDASGNLSFVVSSGTYGDATLTISAKDDGGTANGGVDQSADVQLSIVVTRLDTDGDGIPDDLDQDVCDSVPLRILSGSSFSGIGNTRLSTTSNIDTDLSGSAEVLSPHTLILKAPEVVIKTGIIFRVADGAGFSISSLPDTCP